MIRGLMKRLAMVVLAGVMAWPTAARGDELIAWYRLDTRGFGARATAWLAPLVGLMDAAGLVPADERPVADGLLVASLLGTYPHQVAVVHMGEPANGDGGEDPGAAEALAFEDLRPFRIVLEAHAPGRFAPLREAMGTILGHYGEAEQREQVAIDLPGEREGVRFRLGDWPDWHCLEWYADGERFYLGVGRGALAAWLAGDLPGRAEATLTPHREAMAAAETGSVFVEMFVDPAAMHAALGDRLLETQLARRWEMTRYGGARQVMLRGRWEGTFLVIEQSVRRGGRLTAEPVTMDHWPDDAGLAKPEAGFHLAARVDWPAWVERSQRWFGLDIGGEHRAAGIGELLGEVRPYLLASDYPRPWLPIPGTATVYMALKRDADAATVRKRLDALLAPALEREDASDLAVVRHAEQSVCWLDSPLRRIVKAPAWGWATHAVTRTEMLVISFSPRAVIMNRAMLAATADRDAASPDAKPPLQ